MKFEYAEELLEEVLEESTSARDRTIDLAEGRRLTVDPTAQLVELSSVGGQVELTLRVTAEGPVLFVEAARLTLRSSERLELEGREVRIRSQGRLSLESGDFDQRVAGGSRTAVRDDVTLRAQAVAVEAELGGLSLRANDDVTLDGLRVLMNVPSEEELELYREQEATIGERLQRPFLLQESSPKLPAVPPRERGDW